MTEEKTVSKNDLGIHTCYDKKQLIDLSVCPNLEPMTEEKLVKLRQERENVLVQSRKKRDASDKSASL